MSKANDLRNKSGGLGGSGPSAGSKSPLNNLGGSNNPFAKPATGVNPPKSTAPKSQRGGGGPPSSNAPSTKVTGVRPKV